MFKTRFTEILGIQHPIQVGTMMHISNADFVVASAEAGIFACLASAMFPNEKQLVEQLNSIRERTDKPFGVNVSLFPGHDARTVGVTLDILARENISIIETAGRNPEPYLDKIRQKGAIHVHKCARLRDAVKADKMGVNIIAVVGAECGGHPGMEDVSSNVLIPEVADTIKAPLVAGGGFGDGKGLVSALAMGAEAVVMGTRFLATKECRIHNDFKDGLMKTGLTDTMIIQKSIGSPIRVLRNKWAEKVLEMEAGGATLTELLPMLSGQLSGKAWLDGGNDAILPCGQIAGRIKTVPTIKEFVDNVMAQAEETVDRIQKLRQG